MIKALLLLTVLAVGKPNNGDPAKIEENVVNPPIKLCFDNQVLSYESGQPVYPQGTRVLLINSSNVEVIHVAINDEIDTKLNSSWINISSLTSLDKGTYTVMVKSQKGEEKEIVEMYGFAIR